VSARDARVSRAQAEEFKVEVLSEIREIAEMFSALERRTVAAYQRIRECDFSGHESQSGAA